MSCSDALLGPDAELGALKRILIERTEGKTALVSAKDALRMATDIHPASHLASANMFAGPVHGARGELETAVPFLERALIRREACTIPTHEELGVYWRADGIRERVAADGLRLGPRL